MRWTVIIMILAITAIPSVVAIDDVDWPGFGHDSRHTSTASVETSIPEPVELWDKDDPVSGLAVAQGNFTDNIDFINGSDASGVQPFHVAYGVGGFLYIVDGRSGDTMWLLDVDEIDGNGTDNDMFVSGPLVADVDDDGTQDIVFGTTDENDKGTLYAYTPYIMYDGDDFSWSSSNHQDDRLWRKNLNLPINYSNPTMMSVQDVGDVIAIGAGDTLFVVKAWNKDEVWSLELDGEDVSTPAAMPSGSSNDIVATSVDWTGEMIYFYRFNAKSGFEKFSESKTMTDYAGSGHIPPSPTVLDLDKNASNGKEVIFPIPFQDSANNGVLYAYDDEMDLMWTTAVSGDIDGQLEATPAGSDLDGDGDLEVAVIAWDRSIQDYNVDVTVWAGEDGDMIWRETLNYYSGSSFDEGRAVSSPVLIDVDGDGTKDIVGAQSNTLFVLDGDNGDLLFEDDLPYRLWAQPAVFNMGNDLYCELLAGSLLFTHDIADLRPVDIEIDPPTTEEGSPVNITAIIENSGGKEADSVKVHLIVNGDPIKSKTIGPGGGGDRRTVKYDWRPKASGTYEIKIAVDPEQNIDESDESNNNMTTTIDVSQVLYINVTPLNASVDPEGSVDLTVDLENRGSEQVNVNLSAVGPVDWTTDLDDDHVDIPSGGNATVNLTITPDQSYVSGLYNITVSAETALLNKNETAFVFLDPTYDMRFGSNISGGIPSNQTGNFTLVLFNDGNAPDNATIVVDAPGAWEGEAQQPVVTVGAFSSAEVVIDVTAPDIDEGTETIGVEAQFSSGTTDATIDIEIQVPDFEAESIRFYREDGVRVGPGTSKHPIAGRETRISLSAYSGGEIGGWTPVTLLIDDVETETKDAFMQLGESTLVNFTVTFEGDANITVAIDPKDDVHEVHESDNNISVTVETIPSNTDAEYHVIGTVYQPGGSEPAPKAHVNITVVRTATEIKFQADEDGEFDIDLSEVISSYREGEVLRIYASDGINRTTEQVEVIVFSEDGPWVGAIELNFSQYYFYMEIEGDDLQYADNGDEVEFDFTVVNEDDRENNITFQIIGYASWPDAFITDDGDEVDGVSLPASGSVDLVMHIPVYDEAESDSEPYSILLNGRSERGEDRPPIELLFNVVVVHRSELTFTKAPDARHFTPNGTVVPSEFSCDNDGNGDEELSVTVETDLSGNWSFELVLEDSYESQNFTRDDDIEWLLLYGDSLDWTFTPYIPDGTSLGDHWFNLTIEALNATYNASIKVRVQAADLTVVTVYSDEMLQVDSTIEVTVLVRNSGNLAVLFDITFDSEYTGGNAIDESSDQERTFVAGGTDHQWTVFWVPRETGSHRITVAVDPDDEIDEDNEDNNDYSVTLRVVEEQPDFNVTYIDVLSDPVVDSEVEIQVTVENSGVVDSEYVDVVLVDSATDEQLDSDRIKLEAGESDTISLYWTPRKAGAYDLEAIVDPDDEVNESSERNNKRGIRLDVEEAEEDGTSNLTSLAILAVAVVILALLFGRRHITLPKIKAKAAEKEAAKDGETAEGEGEPAEKEKDGEAGDEVLEIDDSGIVIVGEDD